MPASTTCSPTFLPSFIIGALRQESGPEVTITILEGLRLEELVAYLGTTELTMDLDEFRTLVTTPPPDLLAAYPFLAELPAGRTLEGYLYPTPTGCSRMPPRVTSSTGCCPPSTSG